MEAIIFVMWNRLMRERGAPVCVYVFDRRRLHPSSSGDVSSVRCSGGTHTQSEKKEISSAVRTPLFTPSQHPFQHTAHKFFSADKNFPWPLINDNGAFCVFLLFPFCGRQR
jgi:hypothetical protein